MKIPNPFFPRRAFVIAASLLFFLVAASPFIQAADADKPLIAYVGTYTSPLQNMRDTQVDLPPGNGRGIHIFDVNRKTGAMTLKSIHEMGNSPSALLFNEARTRLYSANETERIGDNEAGSVSAFAIDPGDGSLKML